MTAALRVALVLGTAAGGTAAHVRGLVTGCAAAGIEVCVLAPPSTLAAVLPPQPAGLRVASIPVVIGDRPHPARDLRAIRCLRSALRDCRPGVVHAHGVRAGALTALALLPDRDRPPLIVTAHNAPPSAGFAAWVFARLERICARRGDLLLGASADLVTRWRSAGARAAEPVAVAAPAAAPPDEAAVRRARADLSADGLPVVLAVARLAPQKGLDVLVAAASRWRDRQPPPRTVIAGSGPLADALRDQAERARADVVLLGGRSDVPALLAAADVVVVPSRWEARSLVLQEAMAAGRPVVATNVGGTAELTGDDGALLVPPGDPAALAAAVSTVLDDPALAARLGESARMRSRAFPSEADVVADAVARYRRLAREPAVRPRVTKLA